MSAFLERFDRELAPRLAFRAHTFRRVFELLEESGRDFYTIVETGVAHLATADGAPNHAALHGHSTLLFDEFVNAHDGVVYSVELSLEHCERARAWVSDKVRVFCQDSRAMLSGFRPPTRIDCVYLDSYDVDWQNAHPSALHHMHELCALLPSLEAGCLVFVDDAVGGGGKAGYVIDVMERLGAERLFLDYQVGWRLREKPRAIRAFGHHDAAELEFLLGRARRRRYRYVRAGLDERVLELEPDGTIGLGRAACEDRWFAEHLDDGRMGLVLAGGGRVTAHLRPTGREDEYEGRWRIFEAGPVELLPLPEREEAVAAGRYWLDAGAGGARLVELGESHDVAWGHTPDAATWRVERDERGTPALILSGRGRDAWRFERDAERRWRGHAADDPGEPAAIDFLGPVTAGERAARAAAIAQKRYRYFCGPRDDWPIELLPNGAFGRGASDAEAGWDFESDGDGGLSLLVHGRGSLLARFADRGGGGFEGAWPLEDRPMIRLEPRPRATGASLMSVILSCLPRDDVRRIVEVGSGDGADALAMQRHFGADVIALECNPDMVPYTRTNLAAEPRIRLVEKAAGTTDGHIDFYKVTNGNPYASSCFHANPAYPYERYVQERVEVEMTRLDRCLDEHGVGDVDFLALDVQGGALAVIEGMGARLDRVRFISAELDTRSIYHGEALTPAVVAVLAAHGFHLLRCFDQWGVTPAGELIEEPCFTPQYAGAESWFGDYLFLRPNARERAAMNQLAGRRFRYQHLDEPESDRELELLADGQIGAGRVATECNWIARERRDGLLELLIIGLDRVACRLTSGSDGRWRGHSASLARAPIVLEPIAEETRAAAEPLAATAG